MSRDALYQQVGAYNNWRNDLITALNNYQTWREEQNISRPKDDLCIYELIENLKSEKLTIALIAEFSRGKTELINAIFFSDHKQRLLPTNSGRTTMCPTEIGYDHDLEPCIKLLPIETRINGSTIAEYRKKDTHWTKFKLDQNDPKKILEQFEETSKTKRVSLRDAEELGLYNPNIETNDTIIHDDGTIDIPIWRHAIINYPHPMLKQGLVIIDTPGFNSLGTEPELTFNLIPKAQAIIFVLDADTGVTRSDYACWQHIRGYQAKSGNGYIAVLNKIDALWDQLHDADAIKDTIHRQVTETAKTLCIDKNQIFPVSAQKGLIGKVKNDPDLIRKSGLLELERKLSEEIIPAKQLLTCEKIKAEIHGIVETTNIKLKTKIDAADKQLNDLGKLQNKNVDAIRSTAEKLITEKQAYEKSLSDFHETFKLLDKQIKILDNLLDVNNLDPLIDKTRREMNNTWTTTGLRTGMKVIFDNIILSTNKANKQTQYIKRMVQSVCNHFYMKYKIEKCKPANFSSKQYCEALIRLRKEAEAYINSPTMVMSEQHFVIKRFFITLVSQARFILSQWNDATITWTKSITAPIAAQIHEHKIAMEQRINTLNEVKQDLYGLRGKMENLEEIKRSLEQQILISENMLAKITQPLPTSFTPHKVPIAEKRLTV